MSENLSYHNINTIDTIIFITNLENVEKLFLSYDDIDVKFFSHLKSSRKETVFSTLQI